MKTAKGLVAYAQKALKEHWGYVWGTFGQVLTPDLFDKKLAQYPEEVGRYADFIKAHWVGRRASDCVGLIKSFLWYDEADDSIKYVGATDVSANGMYNQAKVKGAINTMPDKPGLCLWKQGHIGVYIGGGEVIEANSTKRGVIKTPLHGYGSTPWTHWLECPFIEYPADRPAPVKPITAPEDKAASITKPALKMGSTGDAVKELQKALCRKGYPLAVDGDFGAITDRLVREFQARVGLPVDGVVGPLTWSKLA